MLFHLIACDPPTQPFLPVILVHAEIPAFIQKSQHSRFATSPNYTARPCLDNSKRAAFLRFTSWSFPVFPMARLGILHLTSPFRHQAASYSPSFPGACCSVALVTFTTEDVPMWSFFRATCKEFGLIAKHTDFFGASPCVCLSLSPSQLLSRHTDPSLGPYHFAN